MVEAQWLAADKGVSDNLTGYLMHSSAAEAYEGAAMAFVSRLTHESPQELFRLSFNFHP